MGVRRLVVLAVCLATTVMAAGEYEPPPPVDNDTRTQFDLPQPQEDAMQGTRDEAKDPSKWIMNLAVTKNPPWKRYRRPTTRKPEALAQEAEMTEDSLEMSVNPE